MKQKKTPTTVETIESSLNKLQEISEKKNIEAFVFVGVYSSEDQADSIQSFFFGVGGREPQLLGGVEIAKRDLLNQIPALKKGEI